MIKVHSEPQKGGSVQNWYLVRTKVGQEAKAQRNIESQGVDVYAPTVQVETKKRTIKTEPVFASYLFVKQHDSIAISAINSTRGVMRAVRFGQDVATVHQSLIDRLRARFDDQGIVRQLYSAGDTVEITQGPLAGLQAIYQEPDKHARSYLLVEIVGKLQRMSFDDNQFEQIG